MENLAPPEQDARPRLTHDQAQELVLRTVATEAESLLRTAYRHSLCADDAHDAYQRGMEIFLRRAPTLDPASAHKWLHVVVKHEAMEVRRGRTAVVGREDVDFERHASPHTASPEEHVLGADRTTRATEALKRLKPQELRAMWLKAMGHSYADAAGNVTAVDRPEPLKTDNNAPAAPVGLVSPAAVSTVNRFEAHWSLPADSGSPIVAARYQVCQVGACGAVQTAPSLTSVDGVMLPAAGEGSVRVWLVDELGHEAPGGAAQMTINYAPQPAPVPQSPEQATPSGPSAPGTGSDGGTGPIGTRPVVTVPDRPPAPKADAALKLTSVRVARGRVSVRGTVSSRASGRLTVRFRARARPRAPARPRLVTITARPVIRKRAFTATLTLPRSLDGVRSGTVSVAYPGDVDTRAASRQATVRWRP
jgi:DNA-directed RNA polymerase specialized sigma24 family protein